MKTIASILGIIIGGTIFYFTFVRDFGPKGTPVLIRKNEDLRYSLESHVDTLAVKIKDRSVFNYANLADAEKYIVEQFKLMGYFPDFQHYEVSYGDVKNIIATKEGTIRKDEILLVGAHYDTRQSPGADDNASGVAGMLEIARFILEKETKKTVKFVAFVNEEPPFFKTGKMGSWVYTRKARKKGENIVGAIILEMIGYYSDRPGSQMYPPIFNIFYPDKGNYVAVIGNMTSRGLVKDLVQYFKTFSRFPIEYVSAFGFFAGFDFSDHWSFWKEDYKALMVTDTAFYRNPNYHKSTDTYDTINFDKMTDVVQGLQYAIYNMAK